MKKYMFMAVAGMLALSSCSSDDNEQTPQNTPRQMTFTAGFGDGTQTRTTLNADKSVKFDRDDAISIFSENNNNVQFTTSAGGATATFSGTAVAGDATYYAVYPYNDSYGFSNGIVSGVTIEGYQQPDIMMGETWVKSTVISYATTTGSELQFHNACALLKITNNTGWGTEIHISAEESLAGTFNLNTSTGVLTATAGTNSVTTRIDEDNATVYLAIAPGTYTDFTAAKSNMDDYGKWYSKTKASVTFQAGKIYDLGTTSDWMTQSAPALNLTSPAVGQVIGSDGKNYDYLSLPVGVTAVAKICYVSDSNVLALALEDEGNMNWSTAISTCAAHTPAFTGGTWKLATKDEWNNMITAAGSYMDLRDGFSSVGGSNLLSNYYWSSTEYDSGSAWIYGFFYSDCGHDDKVKDYVSVRACLAWTQAPAAPAGNTVDLSTLTADYEAQNGDVLTNATTTHKVEIAAGATVTLDGATISGDSYCIKCLGSATIILKDGTTNSLTSTSFDNPALWAGDTGTTLTIQGNTGKLIVSSGMNCAGIGGGYANTNNTCGNIRIEGGVITATGGMGGAGIGTDAGLATCGDIIITGGTITANSGGKAAGIGSGYGDGAATVCGYITIANTVTKVTATAGEEAPYSIGKGGGRAASCGTVTIGGTGYGTDGVSTSPYTYQPSN
ncbi:MAG: hypothetical protein K5896_03850 [Prevotella sp.]|nr:hypothetical protein [Prevotella sp.]